MFLPAHTSLRKALIRVRGAMRGLSGTADRPLARRNARKRILAALTYTRNVVDREFPALTQRKTGKRLKTFEGRRARLKGYVPTHKEAIPHYAEAGVPVRHIKHREEGKGGTYTIREGWFVPQWAAAIGPGNTTALRSAKRSVQAQRAAMASRAMEARDTGSQ